jgi:hypothetical protein
VDRVYRQQEQERNKKYVWISCVPIFNTLQFGFRPDSIELLRRRSQQRKKRAVRAYAALLCGTGTCRGAVAVCGSVSRGTWHV